MGLWSSSLISPKDIGTDFPSHSLYGQDWWHQHYFNFLNIVDWSFVSYFSGGGWTLVVSISSLNRNHLIEGEQNCFNSSICVPYEVVASIPSRKMKDEDIHWIAPHDGMKKYQLNNFNLIRNTCECPYTIYPVDDIWLRYWPLSFSFQLLWPTKG